MLARLHNSTPTSTKTLEIRLEMTWRTKCSVPLLSPVTADRQKNRLTRISLKPQAFSRKTSKMSVVERPRKSALTLFLPPRALRFDVIESDWRTHSPSIVGRRNTKALMKWMLASEIYPSCPVAAEIANFVQGLESQFTFTISRGFPGPFQKPRRCSINLLA